jgi:acetyl esterase
MPVHPEVQKYMDLIAQAPSFHTMNPTEVRQLFLQRKSIVEPVAPKLSKIEDIDINQNIQIRLYRPSRQSKEQILPFLVYYHGGGMMIGDLETHDTLCRELCQKSDVCVIAVNYRRAPEHRFPTAVEDSWLAFQWILNHHQQLKIDQSRIAVAGDSAGGTLAAVVAMLARDHHIKIRYQVLIYPATDQTLSYPSIDKFANGYVLTKENILFYRKHYIDQSDLTDFRASPILASNFSNLAQAFVLTAGFDPLVDEGFAYAEKLKAAGNSVEYKCYPDMIHGFIRMGGIMQTANLAVLEISEKIKKSLS